MKLIVKAIKEGMEDRTEWMADGGRRRIEWTTKTA